MDGETAMPDPISAPPQRAPMEILADLKMTVPWRPKYWT
jgi:hypothetical protein